MKIKNLFNACFSALACLALVSASVVAQQPFGNPPEPDNQEAPDEPIIVRPNQDRAASRSFQLPDDLEQTPDQSVLLNAKYAGWEEAGAGSKNVRLSKDLRANWIMVDSNGRFSGEVIPGEGTEVVGMTVFLMHMGRLVKEAKVNDDGIFDFTNVREGAYSLIGWGAKGFFAFGVDILEPTEESSDSKIPNAIQVIAFQNETSINTDWIRYFSPRVNFRVFGRYPGGQGQDDPAALYGFDGLTKFAPKAMPATSIRAHSVQRTAAGGVLGRIHQLTSDTGRPVDVRSTKVMLLKGDDVVAATDADNYGVFHFPDVAAGQYGLLAVGVDGVGLIGIDVGDSSVMNDLGELSKSTGAHPFDFCLISSETIGWLNNYATELAYRRNLLAPRRPSPDERNQTCQNCGGSGCNSCGGTGICRSRGQSFEDWAASCIGQHEKTKIGSGFILSEGSKDLRKAVQRGNKLFEDAFYGSADGGSGVLGGDSNYSNNGGSFDYDQGQYDQGQYDQGAYGSGN